MGVILLVFVLVLIPRTIKTYQFINKNETEYNVDNWRRSIREMATVISPSWNQRLKQSRALEKIVELRVVEALTDLAFVLKRKFYNQLSCKDITNAIAKIGTIRSVFILDDARKEVDHLLIKEITKQKEKSWYEKFFLESRFSRSFKQSQIWNLKLSKRHINNALKKIARANSYQTIEEMFLVVYSSSVEKNNSYYKKPFLDKNLLVDLTKRDIITSYSLLDLRKNSVIDKLNILTLILMYPLFIPGIIAYLVFLPVKKSYRHCRKMSEKNNINGLMKEVLKFKPTFYSFHSTSFAITALGDLQSKEAYTFLDELLKKWPSLEKSNYKGKKLDRYEKIRTQIKASLTFLDMSFLK